MQGVVLGTTVDSNVLSYPVLVIMKEQGAVIGRGGASPRTLGETEPNPWGSGKVEPTLDVGRGGALPLDIR